MRATSRGEVGLPTRNATLTGVKRLAGGHAHLAEDLAVVRRHVHYRQDPGHLRGHGREARANRRVLRHNRVALLGCPFGVGSHRHAVVGLDHEHVVLVLSSRRLHLVVLRRPIEVPVEKMSGSAELLCGLLHAAPARLRKGVVGGEPEEGYGDGFGAGQRQGRRRHCGCRHHACSQCETEHSPT